MQLNGPIEWQLLDGVILSIGRYIVETDMVIIGIVMHSVVVYIGFFFY